MRKIYSALDIGSSFIKLVVGEFLNGKLNILCAIKGESKGFKNNQITNSEKLIKSINNVLNEASTKLNFKIKKLIVNIPTDYNDFKISENKIDIESEDEIVTSNDVLKVLQTTSKSDIKETEELLASIPITFRVGDDETDYPLRKRGKSLTLKSVLVVTDKKRVYDLIRLLEKCEIDIVDITTTGLVDYYNFKNKELDEKNTVIVNIGSTTTNISVFSKGIYINNLCLDIGAESIDKEIAYTFNLTKSDAVYLKSSFSSGLSNNYDNKEFIKVVDKDNNEIKISSEEINKIVNKKLIEMLKSIKNNINYLTKKEISYIIITGGLSELKDFALPLSKIIPKAKIGFINDIGARDASFSVSIGMLKYFNEKLNVRGKEYSMVTEEDLEDILNANDSKLVNNDNILNKVFSYFFDN